MQIIPRPLLYVPRWLTGKSVLVFFIAFLACTVVYGYPMELRLATVSIISVLIFFFASQEMTRQGVRQTEKVFLRNVFWIGLLVHLAWVAFCYFYYNPDYYGKVYGDRADVEWYMPFGLDIAQWVKDGFPQSWNELCQQHLAAIDDRGYPIWLAIIYLLTGTWGDFGETLVPMIIKCIVSTYCAILIYWVAKRHFGDVVARMACVFVALNPNMIYWCGCMFKEAELVFLCCAFINEMDKALSTTTKMTIKSILPASLIGLTFFLFRAALGLVAFLAVFAQVVFASHRLMGVGKKIFAGILVVIVLGVGVGESLREQVINTVETVQSDQRQVQNEHRAKMKDGNSFARYATVTVLAPLIFTIPFPTFNMARADQVLQMMLSGGSYIKNVFSFFVILSMFMMLFRGEWRRHVFLIAYTCGYLVCLVLSQFAQSGRFHMPIWPMLMLFAAYGISLVHQKKKWRQWFNGVLFFEVLACLAWNWFKLKGRGMI